MVLSNSFAVLPLVAGLISLATGLVVLLRHAKTPAYRLFVAYCLLLAGAATTNAVSLSSGDEGGFLAWLKASWLFYVSSMGAFAHFLLLFPRRRLPLDHGDHPWARRLPRALLSLDRRVLKVRRLPVLLGYLPALSVALLWLLPDDAWLGSVEPAFFGLIAIVKPTLANVPVVAAVWAGAVYLGLNALAGHMNFPEKRRATHFLLWMSGVILVYFLLLFPLSQASREVYAVLYFAGYVGVVAATLYFAVAVMRYGFLISPVDEEPRSGEPHYSLPRSTCFLVKEEKPDLAFRVFSDLVTHGSQGLGLVRTSPEEARETYAIPRTPLVWVGRLAPTPDIQAVDHPEGLLILVARFLEESEDGVVLLDALEYLTQRHDLDLTLQFLYGLRETVARGNGRLIVSLNPRSIPERELSLVEKEMELLNAPV